MLDMSNKLSIKLTENPEIIANTRTISYECS